MPDTSFLSLLSFLLFCSVIFLSDYLFRRVPNNFLLIAIALQLMCFFLQSKGLNGIGWSGGVIWLGRRAGVFFAALCAQSDGRWRRQVFCRAWLLPGLRSIAANFSDSFVDCRYARSSTLFVAAGNSFKSAIGRDAHDTLAAFSVGTGKAR